MCFIFIIYIIYFRNDQEKKNNFKGKICLIIDDFGYTENNLTIDFLNLPKIYTISIIPGKKYSEDIAYLALKYGFEIIIHMPMEPYNWNKISENEFILTSDLSYEEIKNKVENSIIEIPFAKGMNNHQGSKATENYELMKNLGRILKEKNIFFIDSYTSKNTQGFIAMRQLGVKTDIRQLFLDHIDNLDSIKSKLYDLVRLSESMDVAIGIGHLRENTYKVLKEEIPKIKNMGYQFITASKAVN